LNFIQRITKESLFAPPFGGLKGNVRTLSVTHFCYLLRLSGNLLKSTLFEEGWSLWAQISDRRDRGPPTTVGVRKLRV